MKDKAEKERIYPSECRFPKNNKKDKKAFLSGQCKEIEENNRTGKTRDRFNGRYQGNISCKDGQDKRQKW